MAIDRFSREQFESALPRDKQTGTPLWRNMGLASGEFEYALSVKPGIDILVRSSVRPDGLAAEAAKDSIRAWIVDAENHAPLGRKLQAWITRVPGWDERLTKTLRTLWVKASSLPFCPNCHKPMGLFVVQKEGKNKGREFRKCGTCGKFEWTDPDGGPKGPAPAPRPTIEPTTTAKAKEILDCVPTIKDRVTTLKGVIGKDAGIAVWALMTVYENQTSDEQDAECTTYLNGIGFSGVDAEILSSFAKQFQARKSLSDKQMAIVYKKMPGYAAQIERQIRG